AGGQAADRRRAARGSARAAAYREQRRDLEAVPGLRHHAQLAAGLRDPLAHATNAEASVGSLTAATVVARLDAQRSRLASDAQPQVLGIRVTRGVGDHLLGATQQRM